MEYGIEEMNRRIDEERQINDEKYLRVRKEARLRGVDLEARWYVWQVRENQEPHLCLSDGHPNFSEAYDRAHELTGLQGLFLTGPEERCAQIPDEIRVVA